MASMHRSARWLRGYWPDHNPLRRATDRAEAAMIALSLIAFLVIAPLAAALAANWVAAAAHRAAQQHPRQVSAVLLTGARPAPGLYQGFMSPDARARWTAPGGAVRTGDIRVSAGAVAGGRAAIWIDASGHPVGPPTGRSQQAASEALAAALAAVCAGLALLCVHRLGRWVLDRRRMAVWDADWWVTGPRWSGRR